MIKEHWKKIGIDLIVNEVERSLAEKRHAANDFQMYAWNNDGTEHLFTFPGHAFPFDGTTAGGPQYGIWFQTAGKGGKEPPPRLKEVYDKFRKAYGVPEAEKVELAKDIWKIVADEVYAIGIVGLGAASQGVRVAKTKLGNIPSRMYNSPDGKTPGISRPMTFFWKS
jgi:peptide/nickel transport system substrate-binding protein